ncbi:MAG: hypothetical protein JSS70_07135 [Bacteroidetes bacterium]|nr:hypothetical protein [Bacteroidota bacterium]
MKTILFAIALLPLAAPAQDCIIKKETDQFTREMKVSTGYIPLQSSSISVDADKREFDFFFTIEGIDKCFDDQSTVVIMFEGSKQKNTFRNSGSTNCEGLFHFTVRNGPETPFAVKRFLTIKTTQFIFTVNNSQKPVIVTLTAAQQEAFMKAMNCLAPEAKALVK